MMSVYGPNPLIQAWCPFCFPAHTTLLCILTPAFQNHSPWYATEILWAPHPNLCKANIYWASTALQAETHHLKLSPSFQALSICKGDLLPNDISPSSMQERDTWLLHHFKSHWYHCDKSNQRQRLRLGLKNKSSFIHSFTHTSHYLSYLPYAKHSSGWQARCLLSRNMTVRVLWRMLIQAQHASE